MSSGDVLINESIYIQSNNKYLENDDSCQYEELEKYVNGNIDFEKKECKNKYNIIYLCIELFET